MESKDAAGVQAAEVELQGLLCQKVDGNSVTGEGVDDQEIVPPVGFAFERQPAVAQDDIDPAGTVRKIGEFTPRHPLHKRVDLVEPVYVSVPCVGGKGARAESDDSHAER